MSLKKVRDFLSTLQKARRNVNSSQSCHENKSETPKNKLNIFMLVIIPIIGLFSLIWFLIRVIPKPSRATYPCQRAAFPLASGFIIWLMGLTASVLAYRRASRLFARARYIAAVICLIAGIVFVWMTLATDTGSISLTKAAPIIPNQPIGVARGINPGRVVWLHDAAAAKWPGNEGNTSSPYWHSDSSTNPQLVSAMFSKSLRALAGTTSDSNAWDAIFRNFNEQMGKGNVGYQLGEKIAIKINFVLTINSSNSNGIKSTDTLDQIDCSPQLAIALLKQLTDVVGVNPGDISIGDPVAYMPNYWYDMVSSKCPGIVYLTKSGSNLNGRTPVTPDNSAPFYWSEPTNSLVKGKTQDYIPTHFAQSKYFINFAILKSHTQNGITATAKNHFGSLRIPTQTGYYNMHNSRAQENPNVAQYRCLVDLMGHPNLGGKTLLFLIDGLYSGRGWDSFPKRWTIEPFNNEWPSSIFLSQDGVAIDSVAYDFLRTQWTGSYTSYDGYPQRPGTEDYLHEAALAYNPPSGTIYDPAHNGGITQSLGVHEHWNNPIDKQYTRNLGTGNGIELLSPSTYASENGPIYNVNKDEKYDSIQDAILAASNNDHIIVNPGTYEEDIDFSGKNLTISSSDPNNSKIVASTIIKGTSKAVTFAKGENSSVLTGFTITGAATGIYCGGTSPTISKCKITENENYGIELTNNSNPKVSLCEVICNKGTGIGASSGVLIKPSISSTVIAANRLYGVKCFTPTISNCTIAANGKQGFSGGKAAISNSVIFYNSSADNIQIVSTTATIQYSNVQGGWTGTGNIDMDPCFAETGFWDTNDTDDTSDDTWSAGDYHLLSMSGRWVPSYPSPSDPNIMVSGWMTDEVSSPCIDAADPNAGFGDELWPHGKSLNMGAYGGTSQASLSQSNTGDIRDINNDNSVSMNDVSKLVDKWNSENAPLKEDLNLDGIIDVNDLAFFNGNWQADSNNVMPQFNAIEDVNATTGELLSFAVSAADANDDALVYVAAGLPDGAVFATQTFTWTPEKEGEYKITFIVSDNKSLAFKTMLITVESGD